MHNVQTRYFWIILILIAQNYLSAQSSRVDSISDKKIDSLFNLSNDNWNRKGPFDQNIKWLREAEHIAFEAGNWEKQVYCLLKLTTVYYYKKDPFNFDKVVYESYEVASKYLEDNHQFVLIIYNNLSDIFRKKRAYRKSIEFSEKGIKSCSNCSFVILCKNYNKISSNYISLGDYAKAKQYLNTALSLEHKNAAKDFYQKFHSHRIFALLSRKAKNFDQAIMHLKSSEKYLKTFYQNHYLNELVDLWIESIEIYLAQEKYVETKSYLEKVKNSNFLDDPYTNGKYLINLAKFKYAQEKEITEEIIGLIDQGNYTFGKVKTTTISFDLLISQNLEFKGDLFFEHKQYSNALMAFNQALDKLGYTKIMHDASNVGNKAIVLRLLNKKLSILLIEKNFDEAVEMERAILNLIRFLRIENSSASTIDFWANENLKIIEQIIEYNYQQNNVSKVYSLIEENKSNNLVQDITEYESQGYANVEKEKIVEENRLKSDMAYCRKKIFEIKQSTQIDSIELNTWVKEESKLQIEIDSYFRKLESDNPEYYKLKYDLKEFEAKQIQQGLHKNSVIIEYFIGNEKSYVAYLSNDDIEIVQIENIDSLQELSLEYYLKISDKNNADFEDISKKLFRNLGLNKLKGFHPEAKDLIIIADDFLNNIPFETLSDQDGNLLLDQYNIQYQYSARLWQMMKSRASGKKSYDLVGYAFDNEQEVFAANRSCFDLGNATNLKCAEKEVRSVIEILDSKNSIIADENTELFASASNTKILHLATHACLDDTDSEYSRIYFNDTLLTNQDLKLKDFSADLVVLSACETGFGEVIKGEGSMSLSKGFFHAGAKSTLVSLWPVDDCATSDLMGYFYKNLKEGQSKDEALRNAKINYRQYANPEKTHPYYWAGFIVIGDCSPIWSNDNMTSYLLFSMIALALILLLLKFYKSRK